MRTIAIIPARGGSKGIKNKNLISILGKPLIQYTIESAIESKLLSDIWVSSDNNNILKTVNNKNIRLHHRDSKISQDNSPVSDTVEAILSNYDSNNYPEAIMLLQPTSPIREGKHIDDSIKSLIENPKMNSLISVCGMNDVHPARMYWEKNKELKPILEKYEQNLRQDIPTAYYRNGSIYLVRTKAFLSSGSLMVKPTMSFEMPENTLLNIDSPRDLMIAEILIKSWKDGSL